MLPIVGDLIKGGMDLVDNVLDKLWMDKDEEERLEFSKFELEMLFKQKMLSLDHTEVMAMFNDLQSSRELFKEELKKAPWFVRLVNGFVRPYGGLSALTVFFYTVVYEHVGTFIGIELQPLNLSEWQYGILGGIVGFYFVFRQRSKEKGVG